MAKLVMVVAIALGVVLLLAVGTCVWWSAQATLLEFPLDSKPAGARFRVHGDRGPSAWQAAGTTYTGPFSGLPYEHNVPVCYVDVELGDQLAKGRIHAWDGGWEYGRRAVLHRVESMDGAAFFLSKGEVHVQFAAPGRFLVPINLWAQKSCRIDGKEVELDGDVGVADFAAGSHQVDAQWWTADVTADAGFAVELFEWGSSEDEYLSFDCEPGQCPTATVALDDGAPIELSKLAWQTGFRALRNRFHVATAAGASCDLTVTFKQSNGTHLAVRVTHS
jgi:hypothetical protein